MPTLTVSPTQRPKRTLSNPLSVMKRKALKSQGGSLGSEIEGRLARLELAEGCVRHSHEIWDNGNERTYISIYKKPSGKLKGIAVAVKKNEVVETWFVEDLKKLNSKRHGVRIYAST